MTTIQRERLDAQLRGTGVGSEQTVGEIREHFARLMSALPVPEGIRVRQTSLGGRPRCASAQTPEPALEPCFTFTAGRM
jgi:epsilon-lactone hydrolase